jgi:protein SDA1
MTTLSSSSSVAAATMITTRITTGTATPSTPTTTAMLGGTTTQQRLDVTLKLSQLQNLCKRDPVAYLEDYQAQVRRLRAELQVVGTTPLTTNNSGSTTTTTNTTNTTTTAATNNTTATTTNTSSSSSSSSDATIQRVVELIQFVAAVSSSSYKGRESQAVGNMLLGLLGGIRRHTTTTTGTSSSDSSDSSTSIVISPQQSIMVSSLHRDIRRAVVSALILMRNKGCIVPLDLLQLFFTVMSLTTVVDKTMKELLYRHMVNDIRNINKKGKRDDKVNRSIQTFLHRILQSTSSPVNGHLMIDDGNNSLTSEIASKRAVDMVCELYRRRVWTDDRTVAILASAVLHPKRNTPGRKGTTGRFALAFAQDESTTTTNGTGTQE